MTILITIGKIILWLIGGVVIPLIVAAISDHFYKGVGDSRAGHMFFVGGVTFILYWIGVVIFIFLF